MELTLLTSAGILNIYSLLMAVAMGIGLLLSE